MTAVDIEQVRWFDPDPRRVGGAWGAVLAWLDRPAAVGRPA